MSENLPIDAEQELQPQQLLEVGTITASGSAFPGYKLSGFESGTSVATVDLRRKYDGSFGGRSVPATSDTLRSAYRHSIQSYGDSETFYKQHALFANGCELPLQDESFDTVLFSNVINDPALYEADIQRLCSEALRVVRVGGEVWFSDSESGGDIVRSHVHGLVEDQAVSFKTYGYYDNEWIKDKARRDQHDQAVKRYATKITGNIHGTTPLYVIEKLQALPENRSPIRNREWSQPIQERLGIMARLAAKMKKT